MNAPDQPRQIRTEAPAGSGSPLRLYKPGQGLYVRWGSAGGFAIVAVGAAAFIYDQMANFQLRGTTAEWIHYLVPVVVLVGLLYLTYWLVGRNESVVNFMIATESEMKKVNWSSRREVIGATKVVIAVTLALAALLFAADLVFMAFFGGIGVLKVDLLSSIFGGGPQ